MAYPTHFHEILDSVRRSYAHRDKESREQVKVADEIVGALQPEHMVLCACNRMWIAPNEKGPHEFDDCSFGRT